MNPAYIDAIWLGVAFMSGILMKQLKLPTLLGFLIAGFFLNLADLKDGSIKEILDTIASLGITLLLFTIGLKIKISFLIKKEVLLTASAHLILSVLAFSGLIFILSYTGLSLFTGLELKSIFLIGFALSFSSTVFVIKILEERGEMNSTHGKLAIGVLIIQDIFAVLFMTLTNDTMPSIWALTIPLYLYLVRFVLNGLLSSSGHGEMLTIFGFFAPFVAGSLAFYAVNLKADLGALIVGMLLVNHPKNQELYTRMMGYKDFFLVAFFISIGLVGELSWSLLWIGIGLLIFSLTKGFLFMLIFARFDLRARTNFLTSLGLANYSEFGLIVASVALTIGLIPEDWLVLLAITMSLSFIISSPLNSKAYEIFDKYKEPLTRINRTSKEIDCQPKIMKNIEYIVVGIGSIGEPALRKFEEHYPSKVLGIDYNNETIERLRKEGFLVEWGDTTDREFWEVTDFKKIKMIVLAMSDFTSNYNTLKQISSLKERNFKIAAVCHYQDEFSQYQDLAVDYIFDYKTTIGEDLAYHAIDEVLEVNMAK
jgi:glutathione-regulated potassium-efflux system ancillary protein KefC